MADFVGWPVEDIGYVIGTNGKFFEGGLYLYDFDEAARFCGVLDGEAAFGQANGGLPLAVRKANEWWVKLGLLKEVHDPEEAIDCSIMGELVARGYRSSYSAH